MSRPYDNEIAQYNTTIIVRTPFDILLGFGRLPGAFGRQTYTYNDDDDNGDSSHKAKSQRQPEASSVGGKDQESVTCPGDDSQRAFPGHSKEHL